MPKKKFDIGEKVLEAMRQGAIKDLENLIAELEEYKELLEKTRTDVEVIALMENAYRTIKDFEYNGIVVRI